MEEGRELENGSIRRGKESIKGCAKGRRRRKGRGE